MIALTGQNFEAYTQNMRVKPYKLYLLGKDDVLSFKETNKTSRVYLAIGGGFKLDNWLGSNSTDLNVHIGGYHGRKLENGDEVEMKREYTERHHKLFENLKEKRTTDWGLMVMHCRSTISLTCFMLSQIKVLKTLIRKRNPILLKANIK